MEKVETVIIGGGISGLACAHNLLKAERDFKLITDRLGGRLYSTPEGDNLGAAYLTSDYRHVMRFVDKGLKFRKRRVYFWDNKRFICVFSLHNLGRFGGLFRLYKLLIQFRAAMNRMRRRVPYMCQKTAMEMEPLLQKYIEQSSVDFVREHGLEEVNEIYCAPLYHSTLFIPWDEANAFLWMINLFPILLNTYAVDGRQTVERLTKGYEERIVLNKATAVEEIEGGEAFVVHAGDREFRSHNLVVAVPCRNAEGLVNMECGIRDVAFTTLLVRGKRNKDFKPGKTVLLREEHPARVLWPQESGVDIVYTGDKNLDLQHYYDGYEIVGRVDWKTAVQLTRERWRPLQPRPNFFTIGDHNICGLEDSYLTGLFAANMIAGITGP